MCGIAGIISTETKGVAGALERLSLSLEHRGPDGNGWAILSSNGDAVMGSAPASIPETSIGLVHRRLAIVDTTDAAHQPMVDSSKKAIIAYNGEIYNHPELRQKYLEGRKWQSSGDTEVLFRMLLDQGPECLKQCIGMFAFAFLDLRKRRLFLARDPYGVKPLYYRSQKGRFSFASEIKPLLDGQETADPAIVHRYLRYAVTDADERTFFSGIKQVLPGQCLEIPIDSPDKYTASFFADEPALSDSATSGSYESAVNDVRELFRESVRIHLRSDAPLALTLSGGIDSSGIAAMARKCVGSEHKIHAFTYCAQDKALNEREYARSVADANGITMHEVLFSPEEMIGDIDKLIKTLGQPFTTPSIYAQARVFRLAAEKGFKVVLDGQGADELFGGYHGFKPARIADGVRGDDWMRNGKLRDYIGGFVRLMPEPIQYGFSRLSGKGSYPGWLNPKWFGLCKLDRFHPGYGIGLKEELDASFKRASLPMLLRFSDRNAMAVSLENRVPFLASPLVGYAKYLKNEYLIDSSGLTKKVLRDALKGLVPVSILNRREKIGFSTPDRYWFSSSEPFRNWIKEVYDNSWPLMVNRSTKANLMSSSGDVGLRWRVANLGRWAQLFGVSFDN